MSTSIEREREFIDEVRTTLAKHGEFVYVTATEFYDWPPLPPDFPVHRGRPEKADILVYRSRAGTTYRDWLNNAEFIDFAEAVIGIPWKRIAPAVGVLVNQIKHGIVPAESAK